MCQIGSKKSKFMTLIKVKGAKQFLNLVLYKAESKILGHMRGKELIHNSGDTIPNVFMVLVML